MPEARSPDGTRIFYRASGRGAPLLLSSAAFCTHAHWAEQERVLGERLRVVSWDYRGHGLSEAPDSSDAYTFERVIEDLAAVHEAAAGAEPAVLGGLSIGGLVSLGYALRYPARVRALILVNTGPGFKDPAAQARWSDALERVARRFEERGVAGHLQGERARAEILGLRPESPAAVEAMRGVLRSSAQALARFSRHVSARVPGVIDRLGEIAVPTLILVAEHDPGFHRAGEVLLAKLPRASKTMIEGAGHVLNLDEPDRFHAEVLALLEKEAVL